MEGWTVVMCNQKRVRKRDRGRGRQRGIERKAVDRHKLTPLPLPLVNRAICDHMLGGRMWPVRRNRLQGCATDRTFKVGGQII